MKIPSRIKVGPKTYDVSMVDHAICVDRKEVGGCIDYNQCTIEVRTDFQKEQGQYETFLHELVHAIVRYRNIDFKDDDELFTEEIARGLHSVLIDNPGIFN